MEDSVSTTVDIKKAFVTNATANSVAFYAMAFLNNQGYTPEQISKMRAKFGLENLYYKKFTLEELKSCFSNQSAYFINLYKYMNENDRFEKFAENTFQQETYKKIFKNYKDIDTLKDHYHRRIFHSSLLCKYMKNPYEEEDLYFNNTGIFAKKIEIDNPYYYVVDIEFLKNLSMRLCKKCAESITNSVL